MADSRVTIPLNLDDVTDPKLLSQYAHALELLALYARERRYRLMSSRGERKAFAIGRCKELKDQLNKIAATW